MPATIGTRTVSTPVALLLLALSTSALADQTLIDEGREIAFDRKKGNCLSCHAIEGGEMPGNIGPPLLAMKARFPEPSRLKAQISDARTANPDTIMPPFGPNAILTEAEIEKVVAFIHSL